MRPIEYILIYSITWTLTYYLEKKINGAYTRMLRHALHKICQDNTYNIELYEISQRYRLQLENIACVSRDIVGEAENK